MRSPRRVYIFSLTFSLAVLASAQQVQTLSATPTTVAWGYYSAKAKPVLTVHSGEVVEVHTVSTYGSPERLEQGGVAPNDIPASVRELYAAKDIDKGPG